MTALLCQDWSHGSIPHKMCVQELDAAGAKLNIMGVEVHLGVIFTD